MERAAQPETKATTARKAAEGLPWLIAGVLGALLVVWFVSPTGRKTAVRLPGADAAPGGEAAGANAVLAGKVIPGTGQPAQSSKGGWPGFRGQTGTGMLADASGLARSFPSDGPKRLWAVDLGEGYAGAAIWNGRVYVMDYDREKKSDALRCLSLEDGTEIWRFTYPVSVKRNHGMSRTVPLVTDNFVVSMGPKCHVACVDAVKGELRWGLDLVRQFGTTVPPWYAGQCPILDEGRVILAPAGKNALLVAVDPAKGDVLWQSPNPNEWKMTHSSVAVLETEGERMFVYCASGGVAGVSAKDGKLLWQTTDWKISIATVPSPVPLPGGRLFFSGGYDAGSLMLEVKRSGASWQTKTLFKLDPGVFGATQHTPVFADGHLYGIRPDGRLTCLDLEGKALWTSQPKQQFGLGPLLMAGDLLYAMNDSGSLSLFEATPAALKELGRAQVLDGRESWAPMSLFQGRLLARDLTRMVCLDVSGK